MRKNKRVLCLLLAFMLVAGTFMGVLPAQAAEVKKAKKTYEIAVVFDNSGSMYDNKAWCRAKYAMEIFASMMNYNEGDKLKIFPMWEVTTDGSTPTKGGSFKAFDIKNKEDIDKLSNLYTVHPSSTPFEPIDEAHDYLKTSKATEKWLIVLTDGAFNQDKRGQQASIDLKNRLLSLSSKDIKVQYLGFGNAKKLETNAKKYFYAKKSSDTSLKDDLIEICNSIFQRSVLPKDRLKKNTLTLDLSMKNLIVFVQGADAKVESLKDVNGQDIPITLDSDQRTYSKIKAQGYENAPIDNSLAGQVVTFDACPAGTYTLNYKGAEAVQIFYEPDVDIHVSLTNSDGEEVNTETDEISAGDYKLNYYIVDNVTGADATGSELLGKNVKLDAKVCKSDDDKGVSVKNGETITLEPDDATYFKIKGTYLEQYTITTEDNKESFTFQVIPPQANKLSVDAKVLQKQEWYVIKEHEDWEPIKVTVAFDGQPLTPEQMKGLTWEIKTSKPIEYRQEILEDESACYIYLGTNESDEFVEPGKGKYKLTVSASMVDEYEREIKGKDKVDFEVQSYKAIWRWLIYVVILAVILLLILFFMSRKVLPKGITIDRLEFTVLGRPIENGGDISYNRKGRTLSVDSIPVPNRLDAECQAYFTLVPVDRRWTPSRRRNIGIVAVDGTGSRIKVDGTIFEKDGNGNWGVRGAFGNPIMEKTRDANISIETRFSTLRCSLTHR